MVVGMIVVVVVEDVWAVVGMGVFVVVVGLNI